MSAATRRTLAVAVVAGFIVGVVTQLGQGLLPDVLKPVANSISPWLVLSFAIGATAARPAAAAVGGWLALVLALVGYYFMVWLLFGYSGSTSGFILWGAAALAGGLVFGPAGWFWRYGRPIVAAASIGVLSAAFIAESIYMYLYLPQDVYLFLPSEARPAVWLFLLTGVALPILLGRTTRQRLGAYVAVVPALLLAAVGYAALLGLAQLVTNL